MSDSNLTSFVSQLATPQRQIIAGVDVGGQSIKVRYFELGENDELKQIGDEVVHKPSVLGASRHALQMATIIEDADYFARKQGARLVSVGIATPGRFDKNGIVKPGTNPNLSLPDDSFDGAHPLRLYRQALLARQSKYEAQDAKKNIQRVLDSVPLVVANDGNAMLAGMLAHMLSGDPKYLCSDQDGGAITPATLNGRRVGMFGIGTGIGHAIADVRDGNFNFVTDGHASKLWVEVDEQDRPMLTKAKAFNPELEIIEQGSYARVRAEDLFRDPVINAMAGVTSGKAMKADPSDRSYNHDHAAALQFAGKYMARTIAVIESGKGEDLVKANEWSPEDKEAASKTSMYLIGGGVGRTADGGRIVEAAKKELRALGIHDIKLVRVGFDNPAPNAAAEMALGALHAERTKTGTGRAGG